MALKNVDNLQHVTHVAEKNYIRFMGMAAEVRSQFGTSSTHPDGRGSQLQAFAAKFSRESLGHRTASALICDVFGN